MFSTSNVEICLFKKFTTGNQTGPDVAAGLNGFVSFWELWIWTWPSVVSCQSQQIGWIWSQWRKCFSSVQHQNEPRVQIKGTVRENPLKEGQYQKNSFRLQFTLMSYCTKEALMCLLQAHVTTKNRHIMTAYTHWISFLFPFHICWHCAPNSSLKRIQQANRESTQHGNFMTQATNLLVPSHNSRHGIPKNQVHNRSLHIPDMSSGKRRVPWLWPLCQTSEIKKNKKQKTISFIPED